MLLHQSLWAASLLNFITRSLRTRRLTDFPHILLLFDSLNVYNVMLDSVFVKPMRSFFITTLPCLSPCQLIMPPWLSVTVTRAPSNCTSSLNISSIGLSSPPQSLILSTTQSSWSNSFQITLCCYVLQVVREEGENHSSGAPPTCRFISRTENLQLSVPRFQIQVIIIQENLSNHDVEAPSRQSYLHNTITSL